VPPPKTARPRRPGDTDVDPRPPSTGSVGSSGRPSQRPEGGTLGEEVAWAAKEAERLLASGAPPASVRAHVEYIKELAQRALEGEEGAPAPADSEGQASLPPAPTTEIGMTAGGLTDSQLELGLAWLEKIQVGPAEGAALRGSARPTPNVNLLDARGRPVPAWEPWNKEGRALGFDEIVKALKQYADSPDVEVDPEPFPRDDRGDSPGHSVGSTPPTPGEEPISVRFEALLQDSKELREKERGEEP